MLLGLRSRWNDPRVVCGRDGGDDVEDQAGDLGDRQGCMVAEMAAQIVSGHERHHEVRDAFAFPDVEDFHDVRVIDARQSTPLAYESRGRDGIARQMGVQQLHRGESAESRVAALVDARRRAPPEETTDLVGADAAQRGVECADFRPQCTSERRRGYHQSCLLQDPRRCTNEIGERQYARHGIFRRGQWHSSTRVNARGCQPRPAPCPEGPEMPDRGTLRPSLD